MKSQAALVTMLISLCYWLPAQGQEIASASNATEPVEATPPVAIIAASDPALADRQMLSSADQTRQKLGDTLGNYLVAFKPRHDNDGMRVGLPLASVAGSSIRLAYDPANRQMMAQWQLGSVALLGQKFQYQAYVDLGGTVSFALRSNF